MGCIAGAGIALIGVLLHPVTKASGRMTRRWLIAIYLAACSFTISLVAPVLAASWVLFGYITAICILGPLRSGLTALGGIAGITLFLRWASDVKANLTGMPITMLDLRIALENPAGLWDAMDLPHWTRPITIAALIVCLLIWLLGLVADIRRSAGRPRQGLVAKHWARLGAMSVFAFGAFFFLNTLYAKMAEDTTTWHHEWVGRLAKKVGILPFIAYSYHVESTSGGEIYLPHGAVPPVTDEELRDAVLRYAPFQHDYTGSREQYPNIVHVLAESTFDPSTVFQLDGEIDSFLFKDSELTATRGALRVNTRGGGTWITEFESIVGLDARMFGYLGSYTHASLSPFVDQSLATYLGERGYETWAFLGNRGDFYNSRRAYESYGFRKVLDSEDLGSVSGWFETDVAVVESTIQALGSQPDSPFFSYIVLIENHSPHDCSPGDQRNLPVRLDGVDDLAPNCALNEYLRRLGSTTRAVEMLLGYLAELEAKTGRPFVLVVFGDHQPLSFIDSGQLGTDLAQYRTSQEMYTTFFHIFSTTGSKLECCSDALPSAALPTLISGLVANGPDDLYLGENLWLFERCGSDAIGRRFAEKMSDLQVGADWAPDEACASAYQRSLSSFRRAGIVRLGDSEIDGAGPPGG